MITGCLSEPKYENTDLAQASMTASSEVLQNTFPKVILSRNTQVTRTYLDNLARRVASANPEASRDLDSTVLVEGLPKLLRARFARDLSLPGVESAMVATGVRILFDAQVEIGKSAPGGHNKVSLTTIFNDSRQNVIATVRGTGTSTITGWFVAVLHFQEAERAAFADLARNLETAPGLIAFEEQSKKLAEEERRRAMARLTGQDANASDVFKLRPSGLLSVTEVTELLITWKTHHLDGLLQHGKTEELRNYVDEIEHTILEATDASEKEKDEAQRLLASGIADENQHTDLARAYRLRIEVLKPILAALKEEIANRGK
jgi:hypothetical protein